MNLNGECQRCGDDMDYCSECTLKTKCDKCEYNVANLDTNGKCTLCKNELGYYWNSQLNKCQCTNYVNVNDDYKCSKCSELIPGCKKCQRTVAKGDGIAIDIGIDPELGEKAGKYLTCTECGENMYNKKGSSSCSYCSEMFTGCSKCTSTFESCVYCQNGYYGI